MPSVKPESYPITRVRADFPALHQEVHGKPLVYLDSAATSHKPQSVIDAVAHFYEHDNSNVHRGVHSLSERATESFEAARGKVSRLLGNKDPREIVFVQGTTDAVNLVAHSFVRPRLSAGDEILITGAEHHSNIVPWQMLCEATGAVLKVARLNDRGEVPLQSYESLLSNRTKFVSMVHVSNALGTINPVAQMVSLAHERGVPVMVDGAQAVSRIPVDVLALDCDFYAFSGHKMCGPTGIGALYGRRELLEKMGPYRGGGDMIETVTFEKSTYAQVPHRFEAGTPNIAGVIGMGAAIDYLMDIGVGAIGQHEHELLMYGAARLAEIPEIRPIGTAAMKSGVLSFVFEGVHAHDVGTVLDAEGIAVRVGHHCAQPVMDFFGVPATVRASLALYNDRSDLDALVRGLQRVKEIFG